MNGGNGSGGMVSDHIFKKIEKRARDAEKHLSQVDEIRKNELAPVPGTDEYDAACKRLKGFTSERIVDSYKDKLYKSEQLGLFDCLPVTKTNTCPTLLARIGVFPATNSSAQKKYLDDDNAWPFDGPFGKGRRFGPNLTVFDNCVLLALYRLRQKKLRGEARKLPIKVADFYSARNNGLIDVDIVICTITQIMDEFGKSDAGKNYSDTLASLRRIAGCKVEMTATHKSRYLGDSEIGQQFDLVNIQWQDYSENGIIYVQFSPLVTAWLEEEFTYLDWKMHLSLGRNEVALALHVFLSSQKKVYEIGLLKLADTIGLKADKVSYLKRRITKGLDRLKEKGFLADYSISGTGKKTPFKVITEKA